MYDYIVSLVVASKNPNKWQLNRCLSSFVAIKQVHKIQLILVESDNPSNMSDDLLSSFGNVKIINVPAQGIYSAYNSGLKIADGKYVLFFGTDDIALPGMEKVIQILCESSKTYDLFVASCYVQMRSKILFPTRMRIGLIFSNWCHQGIFYLNDCIKDLQYNTHYRVQADHALNIRIVSDKSKRIGRSKEVVSYFSHGGLTSNFPDFVFRNDFVRIITNSYGFQWGFVVFVKQKMIDFISNPSKRFQSRVNH